MRILDDVKLDFSDVLIRPKRSTLESRKNASKTRGLDYNLDEIEYDLKWICLDVANGYTERFMDFVKTM